jgi:hypothetical protein
MNEDFGNDSELTVQQLSHLRHRSLMQVVVIATKGPAWCP